MDTRALRRVSAPEAKVFVLNVDGTKVTRLTKVVSVEYELVLNDVGQLRLECELNETSKAVFVDAHPDASIPVVVQCGDMETVWFATHVVEDYDQVYPLVRVVAVSPEKFLEGVFTWPNPHEIAELQVSKRSIKVGPVADVVKMNILEPNLDRMQLGNKRRVHWVAPPAAADMYTRWVTVTLKMNQSLDLIRGLLDAEGLTLTAELYLPGRGQAKPKWHTEDRPAIIWDVKQRAEIPSGGLFLRGLARSIADFWEDVWATIATSTSQAANSVEYWGKPQLMIRRHQYASLEVETVKPTAWRYTVGGQSPEWLNSLIQMGIGTLINVISGGLGVLLNSSAVADIGDNRIMSYHSFPDLARKSRMGPFGMMETFTPSTGLTLDAVSMMKQQQLKTRSQRSHEFTLLPNVGLAPGVDYQLGSMLALELPGDRYVVAFVTALKYKWTTSSAPEVTVQVADKPRRDPFDSIMRQFTGIAALINKVALLEQ